MIEVAKCSNESFIPCSLPGSYPGTGRSRRFFLFSPSPKDLVSRLFLNVLFALGLSERSPKRMVASSICQPLQLSASDCVISELKLADCLSNSKSTLSEVFPLILSYGRKNCLNLCRDFVSEFKLENSSLRGNLSIQLIKLTIRRIGVAKLCNEF